MANKKYYLKENLIAEPLIGKWYAHPLLISPATAAMFIAFSHLKVMRSYVENPRTHETALEFPELAGGPFIELKYRQTETISHLIDETENLFKASIEFATALKEAAKIIKQHAKGFSLKTLYALLPDPVRAYIELAYDIYNQPVFKLNERLLYYSDIYLKDAQNFILSFIQDDNRPFSLSTPRIENISSKNLIQINNPFCDKVYDRLFSARFTSISEDEIKSIYDELQFSGNTSFENFFRLFEASEKKTLKDKINNDITRVRYFGHACLLIETPDANILLDPAVSYRFRGCSERYSYDELPETIDYVLITHNHQDHVLIEHLTQIRHKVKTVLVPRADLGNLLDPSLKLFFEAIGYENIVEISDMDNIKINDLTITSIPFLGEHGDLNIMSKSAYHIKTKNHSILCIAGSNNLNEPLYNKVHSIIGDVDTLFISMECEGAPLSWLYGALLPESLPKQMDNDRRLDASNCENAWKMIQTFNCSNVYLYAMGMEPWFSYIMRIDYNDESVQTQEIKQLKQLCNQHGVAFEQLFGYSTINL